MECTSSRHPFQITRPVSADKDLVKGINKLLPQLSNSDKTISEPDLSSIMSMPGTTLLVARDEERTAVIGMLTLVIFRTPSGRRAWIEDVIVDRVAQRRGVGEALVRAALKLAFDAGALTIDLTSRHDRKAAHHLYEKIGFLVRDTNVYRYRF